MEIDLLAAGQRNLILIESKSRLNVDDVRELINKLPLFPRFFPEYASHRIFPVAASLAIPDSVLTFMNRNKIYGLAMGDETMELVNFGKF
jgi:hypothetical protein